MAEGEVGSSVRLGPCKWNVELVAEATGLPSCPKVTAIKMDAWHGSELPIS